jgi:hypothetical protein
MGFSCAEAVATTQALTTPTKEVCIKAAFSIGDARAFVLTTCSHAARRHKSDWQVNKSRRTASYWINF